MRCMHIRLAKLFFNTQSSYCSEQLRFRYNNKRTGTYLLLTSLVSLSLSAASFGRWCMQFLRLLMDETGGKSYEGCRPITSCSREYDVFTFSVLFRRRMILFMALQATSTGVNTHLLDAQDCSRRDTTLYK
jgi:hypothetical protein